MEFLDFLQQSVMSPLTVLWSKIVSFAPNLAAALILIGIGYLLGKGLALALERILALAGLDRLGARVGLHGALSKAGMDVKVSWLVGQLLFWTLLLTFLVSATDALGLPGVSTAVSQFIFYIPNVVGALVLLLLGLFVADVARSTVVTGCRSAGIEYSTGVGTVVYGIIVVLTVVLVIGQLQIETGLINNVISIGVTALGAALALAFGLGSRDLAKQILAGFYARELFDEGDQLSIDGVRGRLLSIGHTKGTIETADGKLETIANHAFLERNVTRAKSG